MTDAADVRFMERALCLAERGRGRTTPNPIVGAVVVSREGVVVGQGAHVKAGGPHAEVVALDAAGDRARGATLYVTLEPCCHTGRTGPCVERIAGAGIARVVMAVRDPNPLVSGGGAAWLQSHGIAVTEAVGEEPARRLNAPFFTWVGEHRPFVTLKMALSADGSVGPVGGSMRLTGAEADRWLQRQRSEVDAIAVGSTTVLIDDPRLTARGAYRYRPLTRVIFDWRARTPSSAAVYSTVAAGPVIIVVAADAARDRAAHLDELAGRGVEIEVFERRDVRDVLARLARRDIVWLLVEGGPSLAAAFAGAGAIDRAQFVITPAEVAAGVPALQGALTDLVVAHPPRRIRLGTDTLLEFDVHRTD